MSYKTGVMLGVRIMIRCIRQALWRAAVASVLQTRRVAAASGKKPASVSTVSTFARESSNPTHPRPEQVRGNNGMK